MPAQPQVNTTHAKVSILLVSAKKKLYFCEAVFHFHEYLIIPSCIYISWIEGNTYTEHINIEAQTDRHIQCWLHQTQINHPREMEERKLFCSHWPHKLQSIKKSNRPKKFCSKKFWKGLSYFDYKRNVKKEILQEEWKICY